MDNVLTCDNCGARMRIKPATLKIVKELKCVKCHTTIKIPEEMREAARNGSLEVAAPTVKRPAPGATVARTTPAPKPVSMRAPKAPKPSTMGDKGGGPSKPVGGVLKAKHKSVVITRKTKQKKANFLDPPRKDGEALRPKTIVAPPPASAPVTVAPAASSKAPATVSPATVKLTPSQVQPAGAAVAGKLSAAGSPAASGAPKPPVRLSTAPANKPPAPPPLTPRQAVAQMASQAQAAVSPAPNAVTNGSPDSLQNALAAITALETRIAALEAVACETRLAALEKATVATTTIQQETAGDLMELVERFESLKKTVSGIDNRLACLLRAQLDQSQSLAVQLANI